MEFRSGSKLTSEKDRATVRRPDQFDHNGNKYFRKLSYGIVTSGRCRGGKWISNWILFAQENTNVQELVERNERNSSLFYRGWSTVSIHFPRDLFLHLLSRAAVWLACLFLRTLTQCYFSSTGFVKSLGRLRRSRAETSPLHAMYMRKRQINHAFLWQICISSACKYSFSTWFLPFDDKKSSFR